MGFEFGWYKVRGLSAVFRRWNINSCIVVHKLKSRDKETTWAGVGLRKGVHNKCSRSGRGLLWI
jgi:hypothetical protein